MLGRRKRMELPKNNLNMNLGHTAML
jgi:hypothetical protein